MCVFWLLCLMSSQNCELTSLRASDCHTVHHQECSSHHAQTSPCSGWSPEIRTLPQRCCPHPFPTGHWKAGTLPWSHSWLLLYQGLQVYRVENPKSSSALLFGICRHHLSPGSIRMATGVRCGGLQLEWDEDRCTKKASRKRSQTPESSQGGTYSAQVLEPSTGGCPFHTATGVGHQL